jgi:hypothetical protein
MRWRAALPPARSFNFTSVPVLLRVTLATIR